MHCDFFDVINGGERSEYQQAIYPNPYFNPRSLGGERLARLTKKAKSSTFQSTLPGWGATAKFTNKPVNFAKR